MPPLDELFEHPHLLADELGEQLRRLATPKAVGRRADEGPQVELLLQGGARVSGVLLPGGGELLRVVDGAAVVCVRLGQVMGVRVERADLHLDLLSGGHWERAGEAPGALALSRLAAEIGARHGLTAGLVVEVEDLASTSDAVRLALGRVLEAVDHALTTLTERHGTAFSLSRMVLQEGAPGVTVADDGVVVRAHFAGGPRGRLDAPALVAALERAL